MKNIIVVGPPRVGKTSLSKIIVNNIPCFSVINMDVIRESIYKSLCNDMPKKERKALVKNIFPAFLKTMIKQYVNYYNPDLYYVMEGDLLSIENALEIKREFDVEVICVGVPNLSETDLFNRIRSNASIHGCWTEKYEDKELYKLCGEIINQSKKEQSIAKDNDLVYLDNSYDNDCLYDYANSIIDCKPILK